MTSPAHAGAGPVADEGPARRSLRKTSSARPVVVGLDGSPSGQDALAWAVAEAGHAGRSLVLVNAFALNRAPMPPQDMVAPVVVWDGPNRVLRRARDYVTQSAPEVPLTLVHTAENAPAALVRASHTAELVVVGTGRHSALAAALLGSTAVAVAARSASPVVVVHRGHTSRRSRTVVVGVDETSPSPTALHFAARWAQEHGSRLFALCAYRGDHDGDAGRRDITATARRSYLEQLEALLEPTRRAYPDLDIDTSVPFGRPASLLVAESAAAQLIVVGGRRLGSVRGLILGSVSGAVLRQAHCPVAVVHGDPELQRSLDVRA